MLLGAIAVLLAVSALAVSLAALLRPQKQNERVLRGFQTLETDFEALRDLVQSQLGRISRLKREISPPQTEKEPEERPLTRSQLLARAKRGNRGDVSDVPGNFEQ